MKRPLIRIPKVLWFLFCALYLCVMLWLLFFMRLDAALAEFRVTSDYGAALSRHFDPIPGQVIVSSLRRIFTEPLSGGAFMDLRNLAGNIVLFLPLGWILPYFLPRARTAAGFLLCAAVLILTVEFAQAFTLLGFCDFDDLLLNVLGGWLGWRVFPIPGNRVSIE